MSDLQPIPPPHAPPPGDAPQVPPPLAEALSAHEVEHGHRKEQLDEDIGRLQHQTRRLEDQIARLREQQAQARQQLHALLAAREEHEQALPLQRSALVSTHLSQVHDELVERAQALARLDAARRDALQTALTHHPDIAQLLQEQDRFSDVELDQLPPSYREAILRHHQHQTEQIRAFLQEHDPGHPALPDLPLLSVDVALSLAPEAERTLVHLAAPLPASLRSPDAQAPELLHQVLARILEATHRAAAALGHAGVWPHLHDRDDLLALWFPLPTSDAEVFGRQLGLALDALVDADELVDARIRLGWCALPAVTAPDDPPPIELLPTDDEDETEPEVEVELELDQDG